MKENLLSKSVENGGITLIEHSKRCAEEAKKLAEELTDNSNIINCATLIGLLHDIGKAHSDFQKYLNGGERPTVDHNVISTAFLQEFLTCGEWCGNMQSLRLSALRSILYHHACQTEKASSVNIHDFDEMEIETMKEVVKYLLNFYKDLTGIEVELGNNDYSDELTPFIKDQYGNANDNFLILSSVLRESDIISSKGLPHVSSATCHKSFNTPNGYEEKRFNTQVEYAKRLSDSKLGHIIAPAGFGKTLIGTMWGLMNGKKTWWVTPRNVIANNIYESVVKELSALGLSDVNVGLLLTGEWVKGDYNTCDIIITNIDNISKPMLSTDKNYMNYNIIHDNIVFDEYHEFMTDKGSIMPIFLTISKARMALEKCGGTLFISATEDTNIIKLIKNRLNNTGSNNFCEIRDTESDIFQREITLHFSDKLANETLKGQSCFLYANSINKCQELYKQGKMGDKIFHSHFTDEDRKNIEKSLYNEHGRGKNGTTTWIATNILSTSLDVSFDKLVMLQPTPERTIQIIGRGNRWGLLNKPVECTFVKIEKNDKSESCAIDSFYDIKIAEKWYDFLKEKVGSDKTIRLLDLYNLRREFNEKEAKAIKDYFNKCLKKSSDNMVNLQYYRSSKNDDIDVKRISKNSIRKNFNEASEFYCQIKYGNNGEYTPVFTIDPASVREIFGDTQNFSILKTEIVKNMINYLNRTGNWNKYFKNEYAWKKFKTKDESQQGVFFMNASQCSITPLVISKYYSYSQEIGLYKD